MSKGPVSSMMLVLTGLVRESYGLDFGGSEGSGRQDVLDRDQSHSEKLG